jgi:hypothetical protein
MIFRLFSKNSDLNLVFISFFVVACAGTALSVTTLQQAADNGELEEGVDSIDEDGDGELDGIDTDGDGEIDVEFGEDEDGNTTVDYDGDGNPDVTYDTNGDGTPDVVDTDGDGVPDLCLDDRKILICHYNGADEPNVLCVSESSLNGHLGHDLDYARFCDELIETL